MMKLGDCFSQSLGIKKPETGSGFLGFLRAKQVLFRPEYCLQETPIDLANV